MKKMTIAIISLFLIVGFQTGATARDFHRPGHFGGRGYQEDTIQLVDGSMTVEFRETKRHKSKRRHCFPARMKVWINGSLTKVQVTICKKRRGWIVSPVHINMGRRDAAVGWNGEWTGQLPVHDERHNRGNPFNHALPAEPHFPWMAR